MKIIVRYRKLKAPLKYKSWAFAKLFRNKIKQKIKVWERKMR